LLVPRKRRLQLDLISQPSGKWSSAKPPRVTTFTGYWPRHDRSQGNLSALVLAMPDTCAWSNAFVTSLI
jgi:hypothetical protein